MRNLTSSAIAGVLVLVASMASSVAAPFVAPADGPVAFRRDRIPLNVESMRGLSSGLVDLAETMGGEHAAGRRTVAQTLALSLALNPGNARARHLINLWKKGEAVAEPRRERAQMALEGMRELLDWLRTDEAGDDAHELEACLQDVLQGVRSGASEDGPFSDDEHGRWASWVPELAAYRNAIVQKEVVSTPIVPEGNPFSENANAVEKPEKPDTFELSLRKAQIVTPLWQLREKNANAGWWLKPSILEVNASFVELGENAGRTRFRLKVGSASDRHQFSNFERRLEGVLRREHGELPSRLELVVNGPDLQEALRSKQDLSISGPVGTLASAVITGRKPVAVVIGTVKQDRQLQLGKNFWSKLHCLDKEQGQRLVVPEDSRDYLEAILTMSRPEFFLEHEVMYAKDYGQLLDRALEGGAEAVASASEKFKVIQKYSEGKNIRRYLANIHVKKRLREVLEDDPMHASAQLLLKQASHGRSHWASRKVVAAEVHRILEPISRIGVVHEYQLYDNPNLVPNVDGLDDQLRELLDDVEGITDRDDSELIKRAHQVVDGVRDLKRAMTTRAFYDRARDISLATRKLDIVCRSVRGEMLVETGDSER